MPVRAFIIRPDSEVAVPLDLVADPGGTTHLASLRRALDARFVDRVTLESDAVDAWVDDEYLYSGAERNQLATNVLRAYGADCGDGAILGSVVFAGHDGAGRMRSLTEREQGVLRNAVRQARVMNAAEATLFLQVLGHAIEFGHRDEWGRLTAPDDAGWAGRVIGRGGQVGVVHIPAELLAVAGVTQLDWDSRLSSAMHFVPTEVEAVVVSLRELPNWRDADPLLLEYAIALARAVVPVAVWLPSWESGLPVEYAAEIAAA